VSDLLLASKEDLAKCKIKDPDVTEFAINQVYTRAAQLNGVESTNAYELLTREMNQVKHFNTGVEELDKLLGESGLSSDELVEVSG